MVLPQTGTAASGHVVIFRVFSPAMAADTGDGRQTVAARGAVQNDRIFI
jgi:hypothetical protein